ncbi:NUDIX hydrolase [Dermacoccus sp. 147Ba]|jgi:8-oxo-dGTP pyrophosphatase MutT (NUDIX family)|uniref:NUDIX hydrolase n=1 Tax=Dermacoccus abyssi TaxID=322596 RepID=A0ABX5Z7B1_9MICO|nr:NUDIX hydrolase [Dermacoccus sp. 147Ba]QEH92507.1 NUDIX hydrolase [Dermacoccus abyssi]RYI23107.1 NUDIX hydrolase [Dermacoccus sp. 147Ba]
MTWFPPEIPASAGAMLFDEAGNLLVLEPTYKKGWTIPGGAMEADGESPWDACRREVLEETGLVVTSGRLAVVDTRPDKQTGTIGLRFLFHCGTLTDQRIASIELQESEIRSHRFVDREGAKALLSKPVRRRVLAAWDAPHCLYLENGRPVEGIETPAS